MYCLLLAGYLYICHSYLDVCKLNNCAESLLVLSEIDEALDSSDMLNLVVSPIKRFVDVACNQ